jgi:hypothetical protein
METMQSSVNSFPEITFIPARCSVCGYNGLYGIDIIDVAYVDHRGHESTRCECRDIEGCLNRQGK